MIDIDLLDERLVDAVDEHLRGTDRGGRPALPRTPPTGPRHDGKTPKPAKPPRVRRAPGAGRPSGEPSTPVAAGAGADAVTALLREGRLAEADRQIRVHAAMAEKSRDDHHRHDAATWAAMRALLEGNEAEARAGVASARAHGTCARDADTSDRYWTQRFWIGLEWGDADEHLELLDHCRERAYRYDDLDWRGPLTLLLARLGRTDEALREFDATRTHFRGCGRVDVLCALAEAAWLLGDAERSVLVQRLLEAEPPQLVVVGTGWVCRGSLARYQAHAAAGTGALALADTRFEAAVAVHRDLHARPLLAHTLHEWAGTLAGRDEARAWTCLGESDGLARELRLTGLATPRNLRPRS